MKTKKEDIPILMQTPDTIMRTQTGFGGMTIGFYEIPKGTDLSPLLQGLKNDCCQCPHWGYVIEGALRMKYDDGKEEVLSTGDVFYMPPGHTGIVEEDLKFLDISPEKEMGELLDHIGKKMAEMEG